MPRTMADELGQDVSGDTMAIRARDRRTTGRDRGTGRYMAARVTRHILLAYLVLFALAFAGYSVAWPDAPVRSSDTSGYLAAAQDWSDGHLDKLQDRTPGYPLLLLVTGSATSPRRALFYVSLLLHCTAIAMLAMVLHTLGVGPNVLVGFAAVLLLPPFVQVAGWAMTEALTQWWLVAGFSSLVRYVAHGARRWLWLASLAFAAAALTRPSFQFVSLALGLGLILWDRLTRRYEAGLRGALWDAAILASCSLIAVVGYSAYNAARFGYAGMSPLVGPALAGRITDLYEDLPDATIRDILIRVRNEDRNAGRNPYWSFWHAREELGEATGLSDQQLYERMADLSREVIRRRPQAYLERVLHSLTEFWLPYLNDWPLFRWTPLKLLWLGVQYALVGAFLLSLSVLAGLAILRAVGGLVVEPWPPLLELAWWLAVVIVLYNAVTNAAVTAVEIRYRWPTDLLIAFACMAGGAVVWQIRRTRQATSPLARPPQS
jgi:hypothetical protein